MERSDRGSDPRGALLQPAFLVALGVLVLNDHVLKGAGIVPSAITGKASDVAGLVVAPVALAALVGARRRSTQLALTALVAAVFALTELSQASADALAALLRALGLTHARLVADPSDLWALAVLPLPLALLRGGRAPATRAAPRVSLGVALLACVASPSPPPPQWSTTAYLVNGTSATVDVRVAWTGAVPDCEALTGPLPTGITLGRVVDPSLFGDAITFHLDPGATVPIDEAGARGAVGGTRFGADVGTVRDGSAPHAVGACQLVLLRAEGAPDRIVLVTPASPFGVPTHVDSPPSPERAVQLRADGGASSFVVGSSLPSADASVETAPSTCTTDRPVMAFSALAGRSGTVSAITAGADGCLDVQLDPTTGTASHVFLCGVPMSMLPFRVSDTISVAASDAEHLRIMTVSPGPVGRTLTVQGPSDAPLTIGASTVGTGTLEACNGERLACGAFVVPSSFTLAPTTAGEDTTGVVVRNDATGHTELLVGASERVLLAVPGCAAGRDRPGRHAQLAVSFSPP